MTKSRTGLLLARNSLLRSIGAIMHGVSSKLQAAVMHSLQVDASLHDRANGPCQVAELRNVDAGPA